MEMNPMDFEPWVAVRSAYCRWATEACLLVLNLEMSGASFRFASLDNIVGKSDMSIGHNCSSPSPVGDTIERKMG